MLHKIVGFLLNVISLFSSKSAANIALRLFSIPRKGKITEEQATFLETASKTIFQYKNYDIMTYRWHGNNKTILLIHGWESNAGRWKDLITILQKQDFNIIALDAPAHGNSSGKLFNVVLYSEFIHVILKTFKPDMAIAHSLGGLSTVFSISKHAVPNIKKLVLLGSPSEFTEIVSRYTDMMGYKKSIILQLNKTITERFGFPQESLSTAKNLENLDTEALIIHDEDDDIIPYQDALVLKNSLKNSKLITTLGYGHGLKSERVYGCIIRFLNS